MNTSILIKNTQHIYDLVGLCADFGVEKAVVCPGSRCAPLLIGFGKHPNIETISVTDERSAGFVGLGLAQQTGNPVVLVCTSGTAARSEEHTSELQSRTNLVCRLLLEKKKTKLDSCRTAREY